MYKCIVSAARLLTALLIMPSDALAEQTLYISFDHDTMGLGPAGKVAPSSITGKPVLGPGKLGQALSAGSMYGSIHYPTKNILNAAEGTVAMWVKPVNWNSKEQAFHVFFQALGSNGLVLYKYFENENLLMLASQDMSAGPYFSSGLSFYWKANEWHHVAGTWSNEGLLLFIDGAPVAKSPAYAKLPQTLDEEFLIGDAAWSTPRSSYSLIDEVHIFNDALPPNEIKNLFLGKAVPLHFSKTTSVSSNAKVAETISSRAPSSSAEKLPDGPVAPVTISAAITTRVQLSGDSVTAAGHRLQFNQGALPTQITVLDEKLLSSPIALVIHQNNQRVVMTPIDNTLIQQANGDVVISSHLVAKELSLQVRSTIERDGLITIELASVNGKPLPLDADLTIEMPLKASAFEYRARWQSNQDLIGTLETAPSVDSTAFVPYYWFGNNDKGLFWFSDSSKHWPNAFADDAIRIDRVGSSLLFRQKLKSAGQSLLNGWKYRIGLQPTPVKKYPKSWRKWRLTPGVNANIEIIWPASNDDSLKYYGYPEAANPKKFLDRVNAIKRNNREAVSYLTPSFVSTGAPEWEANRDNWMSGIFDSTSSDVRSMGGALAATTPTSRSWQSFIKDKTKVFQESYKLDGFYLDNMQVYGIYNPQIKVGYVAGNVAKKEYPIFEYRELFKSVIESIKLGNPSSKVLVHMSGHFNIPVLSLADAYIDGEQFRGVVKDNYLDVLSLDQLRAEFMGRQWGLIPIFLPEFDAANAARIEPTRGLMGLLMLHDITVWPLWCNLAEANKALKALDRFGYADSQFIPYFGSSSPATTTTSKLLVSAYKKDQNESLLVVVNVSKSPIEDKVCVSTNGPQNKSQFHDWLTGKAIFTKDDRCFTINLSTQDYALIRATTADEADQSIATRPTNH